MTTLHKPVTEGSKATGSMSEDRRRPNLAERIWRSIFRGPIVPRTDRERKWVVFNTLVLHLRPTRVPKSTLKYSHTFGLGGMSLVLVLLLMATGTLMMFAYEPFPSWAYDSIVRMQEQVLFGRLVRGVHHWSANLLVVVVFLHMLRVFFTGGFRTPRQFNWIVGLCLLFCVLAANFTGYLLPWDQLSYWAVTICTGMIGYVPGAGPWLQGLIRGGEEIDRATLINFYTLHTTVMPVLFIALMALHFWRVRKAGGVVDPQPPRESPGGKPATVLFLPNLLLRETAVALLLTAFVLVLSIVFEAPLGERANPGMSPNPAKAPWYFLGFQELLLHFHPVFAVFVIPLVLAAWLALLPYLTYQSDLVGPWFLSAKGRRMAVLAALTALVVTPLWIVMDDLVIASLRASVGIPTWLGDGLFPFALTAGGILAFYIWVKRKFVASTNEAVQTLFVLLLVSFLVLTATGVWFRGTGMALTWPWSG
jgi:quinol-cytochrome oxidoreductase complex cytochrome b subunit